MEKLTIEPFIVWCNNREETLQLKSEVFTHHTYYFETENPTPIIIDAGAHIGLTTLYFKKIFPDAQIIAVEPHPTNFSLLEKNIAENDLQGITTVNAALGAEPARARTLYADTEFNWHSTASFIEGAWNNAQKTEALRVPVVTLASLISQPIDLLKMDIEGAEVEVLKSAQDSLRQVKHIICEFHPSASQKREDFITFLERQGYDVSHEDIRAKFHGRRELEMIEATRK